MMKNELKVLENDLVPVYVTSTGEKVVYGTELYNSLNVGRDYSTWIKSRLSDCDAIENEDYDSFPQIGGKPQGGRPIIEYIIKLGIAKEMAMLEKNEIGKSVRRYFIRVEEQHKAMAGDQGRIPFKEQVEAVAIIADALKVNQASKVLMFESHLKSYGIPTDFLPDYVSNGNREYKSATELLKENGIGVSAVKFNQQLQAGGYLEERQRPSSSGKTKKFKALTDKGLRYGENLIDPKNQKEVQPQYYTDTFMELCRSVIG